MSAVGQTLQFIHTVSIPPILPYPSSIDFQTSPPPPPPQPQPVMRRAAESRRDEEVPFVDLQNVFWNWSSNFSIVFEHFPSRLLFRLRAIFLSLRDSVKSQLMYPRFKLKVFILPYPLQLPSLDGTWVPDYRYSSYRSHLSISRLLPSTSFLRCTSSTSRRWPSFSTRRHSWYGRHQVVDRELIIRTFCCTKSENGNSVFLARAVESGCIVWRVKKPVA